MKLKWTMIAVLSVLVLAVCGCQKEEAEQQQLIEVVSSEENAVVRQITDLKTIVDFTNGEDIAGWKMIAKLPEDVQQRAIFRTYAMVNEAVYLQNGAAVISAAEDTLYQGEDGSYYFASVSGAESTPVYYTITDKAGDYLLSFMEPSGTVREREEIFQDWGASSSDIAQALGTEQTTGTDEMQERTETAQAGIYYGDNGEQTSFRAEEMRAVSKKQRLEIKSLQEGTSYQTTDLSRIADFYNGLQMSKWLVAEQVPEGAQTAYTVIREQENREKKEELVITETMELYENGEDCFAVITIPAGEETGESVQNTYQIPRETLEFVAKVKIK